MSIIRTVRTAILENADRSKTFDQISEKLGVSRATAKEVMFSFLWFASEEHLEKFVRGETPKYKTSNFAE